MRAIVCPKYGSPDVLRLEEVEKPVPKVGEILVKIEAAATNPLDWHFMRGTPYFIRLMSGLFKPKKKGLGVDIAGTIEAVGENVQNFKIGDEVFGDIFAFGMGGFSEYVLLPEKAVLTKPSNHSFEEVAGMPVAAITALQSIRDKGQLKSGQKILINGSSGGVGTFGVQIARHLGAEVTAVCSSRNVELVSSLGADKVIDYTQKDFCSGTETYDLIIDNVGNRSISELKKALKPGGTCILIGFTSMGKMAKLMMKGKWVSLVSNKKFKDMTAKANREDLEYLALLMRDGKLKTVIDKSFPLEKTADAIRYLEEGHARGKVIILPQQ